MARVSPAPRAGVKSGPAAKRANPLRLYFDTNVFVDIVENRSPFRAAMERVLLDADNGVVQIVTSELTYAEVLIKPLEIKHRRAIKAYRDFLLTAESVELVSINLEILDVAARLRAAATPKPKLPDAIHIATARKTRCRYFLTSDNDIRKTRHTRVLPLEHIEANLNAGKTNPYHVLVAP